MKFLDWLTGRKADRSPAKEEPTHSEAAPRRPLQSNQTTTTALPAGAVLIDYKAAEGPQRRRPVLFLIAAPDRLFTGIDLDLRRLRTFRLDRINRILEGESGPEHDATTWFKAQRPDLLADATEEDDDRAMALNLRKQMLCQVSIMVLLARANADLTTAELDEISAYIRRENRFAVNEGFAWRGDKRRVWPILRDMAAQIDPQPAHLDAYMNTLLDDWDNPRRFGALSEALTRLANIEQPTNPAKAALVAQINRLGQRRA